MLNRNENEALVDIVSIDFSNRFELFACTGRILNEFICFSPTPDVSFIKVGEGPLTGRKQSTRNSTGMEISDVDESDAGMYRCTGTNSNGQTSYEFNLEVEGRCNIVNDIDDTNHYCGF